ncbi:dirigent protein 21-like [Salvia divinorum]|uniref:Dirigent protein 21-like n=1 Tax=Salvia divinorum TaxID=28513 RepID=A0ABD1G8J2_SALDI
MKNLTIGLMMIIFSLNASASTSDSALSPWVQTPKGNKKITKYHFYVHNPEVGHKATVYVVECLHHVHQLWPATGDDGGSRGGVAAELMPLMGCVRVGLC